LSGRAELIKTTESNSVKEAAFWLGFSGVLMPVFGKSFLFAEQHNFFSRLGFQLYGYPFVGGWLRSVYFRKAISDLKPSRILDAGCGAGEYSFYLAEKFPELQAEACDLFAEAVKKNRETQKKMNLSSIEFFQADIRKQLSRNQYDLIFSIDVLQGIREKEKVFKAFNLALKKGGHLFLHIPFQNTKITVSKKGLPIDVGIKSTVSEGELLQAIKNAGFSIIESRKTFGFFGATAWKSDNFLMQKKAGIMRAAALPFLKFFAYFDTLAENREGKSLMVLARK